MDIKEQIEILNKFYNKIGYAWVIIDYQDEWLVVKLDWWDISYIHINQLLFDKEFLKTVFGEEEVYEPLKHNFSETLIYKGKKYEVIWIKIFLSDNRLQTFCNLYLEYNKNG